MSKLRDIVRQVKPVQETYCVDYVERVQNLLYEANKGIDIKVLQKELPRSDILRATVLFDAIKNQTPLETTKGNVNLNWISDADRISAESGDFISAFLKGRNYKPVFVTDAGDKIKLNNILKTAAFGGGRGSGGGAEATGLMECAQCIYAAAIFKGEKLSVGDELDPLSWGTYSANFDVDKNLDNIADGFSQAWMDSSILIGNALKKNIKGTNYTWHRGSAFVKEIENRFKELNKAEKPKPFSNINKWTPADIWAVKNGKTFDFNQFSKLGELTNELKERYDSGDLIGISLKFASGSVTVEEKNTTGFIRRPVKYGGYEKPKDYFSSKDLYIRLGKQRMQLRTFATASSWQGEAKGAGAGVGAGKIGGGVLEAIMINNSTLTKFPYTNAQLKTLATQGKPPFLDELYQMYVGLVGKGNAEQKEKWIKKASKKTIGRVSGADWRFSKFRSMFFVAQLEDNKPIAHKICDNIAAYSLSASDDAAPHVVYK
jgi:hypothetical protein